MIIITGTGRSGTKAIAQLFGGYHEFRVAYILDKYLLHTDPHTDPLETLEKRIMAMLDLHQGIDPETFVDASNLYIHFLDALYKLYPSAKFILTVRHGKDFVRSAASRRWHEQNIYGTVPLYTDPYFLQWEAMTPLQKNAWIWNYRNKKALQGLQIIPVKQKFILRIEDVANDEVLTALETFSGMEILDRGLATTRINSNPLFDFPPKEEWTELQSAEFYAVAGKMMNFFNYA